jgi:hypothetical protein
LTQVGFAYHNGSMMRGALILLLLLTCCCVTLAVSPDESLLLNRARAVAAAPVEDFTPLGGSGDATRDGGYRYQLAFLGYGLCSITQANPALRPEARTMIIRFIEKMEHPTTRAYWKALGYGDDTASGNVMYRGHLNLMYALAHDRFGETRFDDRFHSRSKELFSEITGDHPICCEPDRLFIQCNSVAVLSLALHDRLFSTTYASAGKRLLAWAHEHMPLESTTLVREEYRPSTGASTARKAGYANAWVIAFLGPVPGISEEVGDMYADWHRTFVEPALLPEVVKGAPGSENLSFEENITSSLLATTFGLIAAREQGDERLQRRLEATLKSIERLVATFEKTLPATRRAQAHTFRTISLFARTFRGWSTVLEN